MGGDNVGRGGPSSALLTLPAVMPGLVPGIHVPPPRRPRPARTAMPHGVDARNKSGHDAVGEGGARPRTATRDAGVPKSEPRPARSAGNPLVLEPFAPPERIKPDSNGTSPGMTEKISWAFRPSTYLHMPRQTAFGTGSASIRMKAMRQGSVPRLTQAWLVPFWTITSPAFTCTSVSSSSMSISPDSTIA